MLRIKGLRKTFVMAGGRVHAVDDVNIDVPEGTFLTLLGPSGCGKTTTLRCVAGLEMPDSGEIYIGGDVVFSQSQRVAVPAYKRGVGMVFQSYAIWPHMTVFENVAFPLVRGGFRAPKSQVKEKVRKALARVGLEQLENRPSPLLSGGQQQRVSLARALVYEPRLLLLDEPLSNLDAKLREEMRLELRQLLSGLKITTLYVTHDQEEALVLSDRIAVMSDGAVLQQGTPREIYHNPAHPFVAAFVGKANFIAGQVTQRPDQTGNALVETGVGPISTVLPSNIASGDRISLVFRPEDIHVHPMPCSPKPNLLTGTIQSMVFVGNRIQCEIRVGSSIIHSEASPHAELQLGKEVAVDIPPDRIRVLKTL